MFNYDDYGNVLSRAHYTYSSTAANMSFRETTTNTYYNDTIKWILGQSRSTTVTRAAPNFPTEARSTIYLTNSQTGAVTDIYVEQNSPLELHTQYGYDAFGNRTTITVSGPDIATRTSETRYDNRGQFPEVITNALGHQETHSHSVRHGGRLSLTGPNQLTTTWEYDPFGRQTLERLATGASVESGFVDCDLRPGCELSTAAFVEELSRSNGSASYVVFDELERPIFTAQRASNGGWIRQQTEFDAYGNITRQSQPYKDGEQPYWTLIRYDERDREIYRNAPVSEGQSQGAVTTTQYDGLNVTVTDPNGNVTRQEFDSIGQLIKTIDADNQVTTFRYGAFGNLRSTIDALGNQKTFEYDIRGRKTAMDDPDTGVWTYQYDALGQLKAQTNAELQVTSFLYDPIGRVIQRTENEGITTWSYDSDFLGSVDYIVAPGYQKTVAHDSFGNPANVVTEIDNQQFSISTSFDAEGRPQVVTYPNGFSVRYRYDQYGYLRSIEDESSLELIWESNGYDSYGNVNSATFGNGVTTSSNYDAATGFVRNIFTTHSGTTHQDLSFQWDALGNLNERRDLKRGLTERFSYDALYRVTQSTVNFTRKLSVRYDPVGNIDFKEGVGTYGYDPSHPNAVASVTGDRPATYAYDANGNMLSGAGRTITWTSYNKPELITSGMSRSQFYYGPDRKRFKHESISGADTNSTIYIGKLWEERTSTAGTERIAYINAGGRAVATARFSTLGVKSIHYLHRDHLNSITLLTDEAGNEIAHYSFDAFGKRRVADTWDNDANDAILGQATILHRGYTGHEHLDHLKLVHMNGRVYDPILGRFFSADPFVQFPASTQGFNRYAYVLNNPLSFTDPSGHFIGGLAIGAAIGLGVISAEAAVAISAGIIVAGVISNSDSITNFGLDALTVSINRLDINGLRGDDFTAIVGSLIQSNGDIRSDLATGALSPSAVQGIASSFASTASGIPLESGALRLGSVGEVIVHGAIAGAAYPNTPATRNGPTVLDGPPAYSKDGLLELAGTVSANGAVRAAYAQGLNDEGCYQACRARQRLSLIDRVGNFIAARFSLNFAGTAGYGTGGSAQLTVDGQTLRDNTIELRGEGGKVIGANARATLGFDVIQSGLVNGIYTSTTGCALLGCISGTLDSQGDYSITISVGPIIGTPSFAATPGYSVRREILPTRLDR